PPDLGVVPSFPTRALPICPASPSMPDVSAGRGPRTGAGGGSGPAGGRCRVPALIPARPPQSALGRGEAGTDVLRGPPGPALQGGRGLRERAVLPAGPRGPGRH